MVGGRLGERSGISEQLIIKACSLAVKSHKLTGYYTREIGNSTDEVVFAFGGSWSVEDFYSHEPFGETEIEPSSFPSLKSIGNDEPGTVNAGFLRRFQSLLQAPSFQTEVERVFSRGKLIVFTGHSSGGPIAILAALWCLEKYVRSGSRVPPRCVTFGSPLVGNRIFTHAINRENWGRYFLHFVGRYDIVPRIMLSPLSSVKQELNRILEYFNPKSPHFQKQTISRAHDSSKFFKSVLKNSSSVANRAACSLMGSTNSLLETVSSFVDFSPYRPSGTYIFCTGNGKLVVVENPNSVLQILFYCCQPGNEAQVTDAAYRSLHTDYENELRESLLEMQDVVYLDDQMNIPLSSNETATINTALNDLGLGTRARLCLRAAQEFEKQKLRNQAMIDSKKPNIMKTLDVIVDYQKACNDRRVGYYDAFKIQKGNEDFNANVKRLELAGAWDEIVEMLKRYELPDGFESRKEWIELGTRFRRLVEPLDIANYYRHSKDEDTGTYLRDGVRPKRYKFTQRWREHGEKLKEGSSSETVFWARVEEIRRKSFEETREQVVTLEREVCEWVRRNELGRDVFAEKSTFVEWWRTLPERHRSESCLKEYMGDF